MASSLAAGFALAVRPVSAQTVETDASGLAAGEVRIPVKDGAIPAYRAMPAGGTDLPLLLVVQEIFGVHEHIKDITRRLAKLGYLAIAPELYARQGDVSKMSNMDDTIKTVVSKVPDAQVLSDLDATMAWAGKNNGDLDRLGRTVEAAPRIGRLWRREDDQRLLRLEIDPRLLGALVDGTRSVLGRGVEEHDGDRSLPVDEIGQPRLAQIDAHDGALLGGPHLDHREAGSGWCGALGRARRLRLAGTPTPWPERHASPRTATELSGSVFRSASARSPGARDRVAHVAT